MNWAGAWRWADISAQYRQSVQSVLWALINPLHHHGGVAFLSTSKLVQVAEMGMPYPVIVFTGTLLWSILIDSFNAPLGRVNGNRALLAKINFTREAPILIGIYQTLFNADIKIGILLLFHFLGIHPGWGGL